MYDIWHSTSYSISYFSSHTRTYTNKGKPQWIKISLVDLWPQTLEITSNYYKFRFIERSLPNNGSISTWKMTQRYACAAYIVSASTAAILPSQFITERTQRFLELREAGAFWQKRMAESQQENVRYPPWNKQRVYTSKWMVGRIVSFWDGFHWLPGRCDLLVSGSVIEFYTSIYCGDSP